MHSLPLSFLVFISSHCWIRNYCDPEFLFLKHVLSFVKQRGIQMMPMLDICENDKVLYILLYFQDKLKFYLEITH